MLSVLCYISLYYTVDQLFQNIYLPYVVPDYYAVSLPISQYRDLYFFLKVTSYFMLVVYSYIGIRELVITKNYDRNSLGLLFVYKKHVLDILTMPNMKLMSFEMHRSVMWLFTCPLMLKMYIDVNDMNFKDINFNYFMIGIVPYTFIVPFRGQPIYYIGTTVFFIPGLLFLQSLHKQKHMPFTHLYILIVFIFMALAAIDMTNLLDPVYLNAAYNLSDTVCKLICNIVISDYNDQEMSVRENMDLQSVNFISHVVKTIKNYETDNQKLSQFSIELIAYCKKKFTDKIPRTTSRLKLELLKKILPFDLDKDYLEKAASSGAGAGASSGINKQFDFICVLFMDIVNYTELAKKYSGDIIFKLLDDIYNRYDMIIKKYSHLQKIETIGDAYMVVGDIFRENLNHKTVVREIVLLGLDFIREIKLIKTPDNVPLSIRVGIHMGPVNVGLLGNEIPRLCVVGNTVNMASRLQSTADPDTIQMSGHVYEQADEINFGKKIEYVPKENVFLKNIGSVITYSIVPNGK